VRRKQREPDWRRLRRAKEWGLSVLPSTARFVVLFVALVVVYAFGWRTTKIDLVDLVVGAPDIIPIVRKLMLPDILARDTDSVSAQAVFQVPCPASPPVGTKPSDTTAYLVVSKTCGGVGDELTVDGYNFRPNTRGFIRWLPPVGVQRTLDRITSDRDGHFSVVIQIPRVQTPKEQPTHTIEAEVIWSVGMPYISEAMKTTLGKMTETIFLALMATTFAVIISAPLSFLAARNLMARNPVGAVIYYIMRTIFNLLRSIEPLIMAIIFAVWVGIGPFAGVLALTMHSIAALGKVFSEEVESIDPGPIEAITATGAGPFQTVVYGVIPQIIPTYIGWTVYRWDINVRMSTVIGFVGGGGIGFILQQWINLLRYRQAGTAVWAIAFVVGTLDYLSAKVREKIV